MLIQYVLSSIPVLFPCHFPAIHGKYLINYVDAVFGPGLVCVLRHTGPESLGVIKARIFGISHARGDVVVTLDAHMEVREKWLEPLLYEIHKNPKALASISLDWMKPQKDGELNLLHVKLRIPDNVKERREKNITYT